MFVRSRPGRTPKHPTWVYDAMKENGVSKQLLSIRLKRGYSYTDAVRPPHVRQGMKHKINHSAYKKYMAKG